MTSDRCSATQKTYSACLVSATGAYAQFLIGLALRIYNGVESIRPDGGAGSMHGVLFSVPIVLAGTRGEMCGGRYCRCDAMMLVTNVRRIANDVRQWSEY